MLRRDTKNIVVTSKSRFPEWVERTKKSGEPWAYISVEGTDDLVDSGLISDNTHFLPDTPDCLNLEFDDTEERIEIQGGGFAYPMSEDQAKKILTFGDSHKGYNLLIHCYAGKSRSVAIAQGLMDIFPGVWEISEKSNPLLTPNMEVLRLLHRYGLYELILRT